MGDSKDIGYDFEHPSVFFILEEAVKCHVIGPLVYDRYFRTFRLKGNETILDFGCGGGASALRLMKIISENGAVSALDTSKYWITKAEKRLVSYPNAKCFFGDIRNMGFPDDSFDVIVILYVLHHVPSDVRRETVDVMSRVLKTGGMLHIWEPVKKSHGIPAADIREVMTGSGLVEVLCKETGSWYRGSYTKLPV